MEKLSSHDSDPVVNNEHGGTLVKTASRTYEITGDDESSELVQIREKSLTLSQATGLLLSEHSDYLVVRGFTCPWLLTFCAHLLVFIPSTSRVYRPCHSRISLVVSSFGNGWWCDCDIYHWAFRVIYVPYALAVLHVSSSDQRYGGCSVLSLWKESGCLGRCVSRWVSTPI